MKTTLMAVLAFLGIAPGVSDLLAQSSTALKNEGAQFEAVAIKPCPDNSQERQTVKPSPGGLRLGCFTTDGLIRFAFGLMGMGSDVLPHESEAPTKGGPSWIRSRRFTVQAKTDKPATTEQMRRLMQGVLKERFKLAAHEQSRSLAVYELTQGQGGAKLLPAKEGGCFAMGPGKAPPQPSHGRPPAAICGEYRVSPRGGVDATGITMVALCNRLSFSLDRDVVDKTGLGGAYDLHLEVTLQELIRPYFQKRDVPQPADSTVPEASVPGDSIVTALRKLGLYLKSGVRPSRLIVIDSIQMPSEN